MGVATDERVELTLSTSNFEKAAQIGHDHADWHADLRGRMAWSDREWAVYGIAHLIADYEERSR